MRPIAFLRQLAQLGSHLSHGAVASSRHLLDVVCVGCGVCGVISKIKETLIADYYSKTLISARPNQWFWVMGKPTSESQLPALILGLVWSDISGHEKVAAQPNGML